MCRFLRTRARLPMLLTSLTAGPRAPEVQKKAADNRLAGSNPTFAGVPRFVQLHHAPVQSSVLASEKRPRGPNTELGSCEH